MTITSMPITKLILLYHKQLRTERRLGKPGDDTLLMTSATWKALEKELNLKSERLAWARASLSWFSRKPPLSPGVNWNLAATTINRPENPMLCGFRVAKTEEPADDLAVVLKDGTKLWPEEICIQWIPLSPHNLLTSREEVKRMEGSVILPKVQDGQEVKIYKFLGGYTLIYPTPEGIACFKNLPFPGLINQLSAAYGEGLQTGAAKTGDEGPPGGESQEEAPKKENLAAPDRPT